MLRSRYISINKAIIGSIPLPILLNPPNKFISANNRIISDKKNSIVQNILDLKRLSKKLTVKIEILINNFIITGNYSENMKDHLLKKVKNYDFISINIEEKYFTKVNDDKKQELLTLFAELSQINEEIELEVYNMFKIPEKVIKEIEFHFLNH